MYFGFNTIAKEYFIAHGDGQLHLHHYFLGGVAAGFGFWGFLYPLDVVKSRMQVQPTEKAQRKYSSVLNCVSTMVKEEGWGSFWRGYSPALIR